MKNKFLIIVFLIASILNGQNFVDAFRLGQQNIDFDARTLSLGNSTIGALGSFSSTLINPAAIATVKRDVLTFSLNSNKYENSSDFLNSSFTSDDKNNNTNQFSIILPLPTKRGSAALAFGYNRTRDFNSLLEFGAQNNSNSSLIQNLTGSEEVRDRELAWELGLNSRVNENDDIYTTPINGRLFQSGKLKEEGNLNSWIMSGAAEVAKNLYVGGTVNIISGEYYSSWNYMEDDFDNNIYSGLIDQSDSSFIDFESFIIDDIVDWDITGWDFRLGILYEYHKYLKFGATIKFPTTYTIRESYQPYYESNFSNNTFYLGPEDFRNKYEIQTPMELSAGFSANLPFITFNGSFKHVDYSQMEFTEGFSRQDLVSKNDQIADVFESVINWNLGLQLSLPYPAVKIRTGFMYNPSPYKGDSSDYDKKYFTAGMGFPLAKSFIFDLAYVHGWWNDFGDNYGFDESRVHQDITLDKMVFSVSYVFR